MKYQFVSFVHFSIISSTVKFFFSDFAYFHWFNISFILNSTPVFNLMYNMTKKIFSWHVDCIFSFIKSFDEKKLRTFNGVKFIKLFFYALHFVNVI